MLARLPARREPIEPGARADRARAARLQGAHRGRGARQGRQGVAFAQVPVDACSTTPASAPTWRCSWPSAFAPVLDRTTGSTRVYRELELPLVPILAGLERDRRPRRRAARSARRRRARSRADRARAPRSSRWPARRSTSARRSSSPRSCSRSCKLPVLKRTGTTRTASTAVEVLEELALTHDLPRLDPRLARPGEAEGHLHRRAADAGEPGNRPRAHAVQPGGRGDRAARAAATRTCRTSRSAPRSAARSAAPSSPSPATC